MELTNINFFMETNEKGHKQFTTGLSHLYYLPYGASVLLFHVNKLQLVAYPGLHFGGIYLTHINYLPGWEFVTLAHPVP